jgi:hypothetical protein
VQFMNLGTRTKGLPSEGALSCAPDFRYNMHPFAGIGRIGTVSATIRRLAQPIGVLPDNCGKLVIPLGISNINKQANRGDSQLMVDSLGRKTESMSKIRQAEQNREAQKWQGSPL